MGPQLIFQQFLPFEEHSGGIEKGFLFSLKLKTPFLLDTIAQQHWSGTFLTSDFILTPDFIRKEVTHTHIPYKRSILMPLEAIINGLNYSILPAGQHSSYMTFSRGLWVDEIAMALYVGDGDWRDLC